MNAEQQFLAYQRNWQNSEPAQDRVLVREPRYPDHVVIGKTKISVAPRCPSSVTAKLSRISHVKHTRRRFGIL